MSDLSWREWCSLPSGRTRSHDRFEREDRAKRLNAEARAEHRKELIDKELVCHDFIEGKLCMDCKKPTHCLNDMKWMQKERDRTPCKKYDCSKCSERRICFPAKVSSEQTERKK